MNRVIIMKKLLVFIAMVFYFALVLRKLYLQMIMILSPETLW